MRLQRAHGREVGLGVQVEQHAGVFDIDADGRVARDDAARAFVAEEEALGFDDQATALGVTQLLAEQYMEAAEALAHAAMTTPAKLLPCDPAALGEEACAGQLITGLGKRAFRRPLKDEEVDRLRALFAWGKERYGFTTGIELVIQAMLQSPHFLYRVEMGMPDPAAPGVVALGPYELASRLSYLLWGSMPDEALFAAADAGSSVAKERDTSMPASSKSDHAAVTPLIRTIGTPGPGLALPPAR